MDTEMIDGGKLSGDANVRRRNAFLKRKNLERERHS